MAGQNGSEAEMKSGDGKRLYFNEVATRDGFQMESRFIETDDKLVLIDSLSELGYAKIEVTSFTSAKAIPALRDAEAVMGRIRRKPGVVYTALVPNLRGAERAIESRVDELNLVMSASESHNLANLRMTREQSIKQLSEIIALAAGHKLPCNISISCAFGCPMEGEVALADVLDLVARFADLNAAGITLCDTTGMAYPTQVGRTFEAVMQRVPALQLTAHFHNTRAMGLANAIAAVEAGVERFDSSLGGIGGCPYAPGASGNVSTEDMVHMFDCMGYATNLQTEDLIAAARMLETLIGHPLSSQVAMSGPRLKRHPPPADFAEIKERALGPGK
jgi:hydroxymethylglutaryl-CoA lyase